MKEWEGRLQNLLVAASKSLLGKNHFKQQRRKMNWPTNKALVFWMVSDTEMAFWFNRRGGGKD